MPSRSSRTISCSVYALKHCPATNKGCVERILLASSGFDGETLLNPGDWSASFCVYRPAGTREGRRDLHYLIAMVNGFFADADDGLEAASHRGSLSGRFLRFVQHEEDLSHVVMLHGRSAHRAGEPRRFELPPFSPLSLMKF